ncbi:MAG: protein kinase [Cyanobacteria bacterium P01_A01_bin.116]
MQLHCTRPNCSAPVNHFPEFDDPDISWPLNQKYCSNCGMELILLGRYLPVSILGRGGFGTAFLARDFAFPNRRKCVVKLFQPASTLTPTQMATAQRLFKTEAQVLARLGEQHPQIPNLYASYHPSSKPNQSEELFYLVQEFLDGEDLEKILERDGKFSESTVIEVLQAILEVLNFVHSNGAIHRDVKPSNIMKGTDGRLSLLDFGAVKEITTPTGAQRGPTTICSPDFAPPEQIMNGSVDATSDLYALAATCVVLLTGKESTELRESSTNTWNWTSSAKVSRQLASILAKMLQPRPSDRYPSATAVISALSAYGLVSAGHTSGQFSSGPAPMYAPPINPQPANPQSANLQSPNPQPAPASRPPTPKSQPAKPLAKQPSAAPPAVKVSNAPPQPLSLPRFLGNAAFAGAEGGLLGIAITSLIGTTLFGGGIWLAMLGVLVFLQLRRVIEGVDLLIIAGITLAAVIFFFPLNLSVGGDMALVIVIAIMAAGAVVAIAVIFRLIFQLLSRIM